MANPLDAALDTLFASVLAEDVTHTSKDGVRTGPVRAMLDQPDVIQSFGQSRARQISTIFEIRVSDLATVSDGDIVTRADDTRYRVTQASFKDPRRAVWRLEAASID
jgi:hypothetical protein